MSVLLRIQAKARQTTDHDIVALFVIPGKSGLVFIEIHGDLATRGPLVQFLHGLAAVEFLGTNTS